MLMSLAFDQVPGGVSVPTLPDCVSMITVKSRRSDVFRMFIRWGLQWHGNDRVPATSCREGYAPDIVWAYFGNARARVLVFKGAEPFHQIDRQTDIPVAMTVRPGTKQFTLIRSNVQGKLSLVISHERNMNMSYTL
jgi:hypothetical protein